MEKKLTVAIAGATGFIGRWFIHHYHRKYRIIALSRRKMEYDDRVEWRKVELYSISDTVNALNGADVAIYMVHSMSPSARLNQGNFVDTDLLLADNFARAASENNVKQIIYLGGILPKEHYSRLSTHLKSRHEVEIALSLSSSALTVIRAGLIIGSGGSSFKIMRKLVERLPVLACPKWTLSKTQPISLKDALLVLDRCIGNIDVYNQTMEIGGDEILTYREMLTRTAKLMNKRRLIFPLPFFTTGLSKLWVGFFSGGTSQLVSPLVESLKHTMVADTDSFSVLGKHDYQSFDQAVNLALTEKPPVLPRSKTFREDNTVRSFQRITNPDRMSAGKMADLYIKWLPNAFKNILNVKEADDIIKFRFGGLTLLQLHHVPERSSENRHLFYITGGVLVRRVDYGWLEFRNVLQRQFTITAIHEFIPRLPWFIYTNTQAKIHLWVMRSFSKYILKLSGTS